MSKVSKRVYKNFLRFCEAKGIKVRVTKEVTIGSVPVACVLLLNARMAPTITKFGGVSNLYESSDSIRGAVGKLISAYSGNRITVTLPPSDEEDSKETHRRVLFPSRSELEAYEEDD